MAAQTVAAVDAARHFACGIEAGDRLAAGIEHMALFIHHQSAHGMVGGWSQPFPVETDTVLEGLRRKDVTLQRLVHEALSGPGTDKHGIRHAAEGEIAIVGI